MNVPGRNFMFRHLFLKAQGVEKIQPFFHEIKMTLQF